MSKPAKILQVVLLIVLLVAGINFYRSIRERRTGLAAPSKTRVALDPDYYVTPKKLHPQDLKDAKELTEQPVWVREGYRFTYYPYAGHTDFQHPAGTLGPIEKLNIVNIAVDRPPQSSGDKQVMAVFQRDGNRYAFPVGTEYRDSYQIFSDDILFVQDPHELYKHWSGDIWKSIDNHEVKPGMNEFQASFAIGMGSPEGTGEENPRIVDYPNNGHPLRVTYTNGKISDVQPGA